MRQWGADAPPLLQPRGEGRRKRRGRLCFITVLLYISFIAATGNSVGAWKEKSIIEMTDDSEMAALMKLASPTATSYNATYSFAHRSLSAATLPPVHHLTDVPVSELARSSTHRFLLRLNREECPPASLDQMRKDICGSAFATCIKDGDHRYVTIPIISVLFHDLHELVRVRETYSSCIVFIERDLKESVAAPVPTSLWNLDRIDQNVLPLDGEFDASNFTGAGVNIFVIDTGVWWTHEEFSGRFGENVLTVPAGAYDVHGHGTHCAGTAAGTTYGVAKEATVHSIKVLDDNGSGTSSDVIEALDWIMTHTEHRPAVVSMSLGGTYSWSMNLAIEDCVNSGITVIVAAGNNGRDACAYSPSSAPMAVTVGSTDNDPSDTMSSFSNFGSCVDIFAPGRNILSSITGFNKFFSNSATAVLSGTSMAAPLVSGAAALYLEAYPNASPTEIRTALLNTASIGASALPMLNIKSLLTGAPPSQDQDQAEDNDAPQPPPAPFECNVSPWSDWTACSNPCGSGARARYRFISSDTNGVGIDELITACPSLSEIEACFEDSEACSEQLLDIWQRLVDMFS